AHAARRKRKGARLRCSSMTKLPTYSITKCLQSVPLLPFPLVRLLQVFARFVQSALRIVSRLNGLAVFVHRARALAGNVKNLAQHDVAPDFRPSRLGITVQ